METNTPQNDVPRNIQAAEEDPLDEKHLGAFVECQDSLATIQKLLDAEINRLKDLETKDPSEFDLTLPGWGDFEPREIPEYRGYLSNVVLKWCNTRSSFFAILRKSYLQAYRKDTKLRIGLSGRICLKQLREILKLLVEALSFRDFQGPYRFSLRQECKTLLEKSDKCLRRAFDDTSPHKTSWFGRYESKDQDESALQNLDELSNPQDPRMTSVSSLDSESQSSFRSRTSSSTFRRLASVQSLKYLEILAICVSLVTSILISFLQKDVGNGFTVGAYLLGVSQLPIIAMWKYKSRRSQIVLKDEHED